jgi:predicted alpha/beta hydrolase
MIFLAYLVHGDYNVIVVDWGKIAKSTYVWASMHVVNVGKHVAKMIDFLEEQGIDLGTTSLSGHSLGAHVMGLAGYYAKNKVNYIVGKLPRVLEIEIESSEVS